MPRCSRWVIRAIALRAASFWKGSYYAQIIASNVGEEIRAASEAVARALAERLEDGSGQVWGLEELPRENRVSVQYFKRDALSLDFLGETYTALPKRCG